MSGYDAWVQFKIPIEAKDLPIIFVEALKAMCDDPVYGIYAKEAFKQIDMSELLARLKKIDSKLEPQNQEKRFDIKEAAEYLKTSIPTLRRRIKDGSIRAVKELGKIQIYKRELDVYLSAHNKIHASPKFTPGKKPKVDTDKIIRNLGLKKHPKRGDR